MHRYTQDTEHLAQRITGLALDRMRMDAPLDGPRTPAELEARAGITITPEGLGGDEALRRWVDVLAPATMSVDHPRYLAFIPGAPTEVSTLFDLLVSVQSIYGGSWLESSGAVYAENQALRWISDLAGLPAGAGGCFVPGGTTGNLSALVAARHAAREARGGDRPGRWRVALTAETHSSVVYALEQVMDVDVLVRARRRARPDDRRRAGPGARRGGRRRRVRRRGDIRHHQHGRDRRPGRRSPRYAASAGCGCTSTARTAARRWRRRRCGTCSPGSSTPTASSSTRTSGCSRRSTAAPWSTATRQVARRAHTPARRLPGPDHGRRRVEPLRLRRAPVAARPRAAVLVLARRARHRRLPRRDRADAAVARAGADEIRSRP